MNSGIAVDERVKRTMDRLGDLLIPFVCERTGWSPETVQIFLDTQNLFWELYPDVEHMLMQLEDDD